MPVGSRIRDNNVFGAITDNPLAIGATTFNSVQLGYLGAVVGNHAVVTLDPIRQFGEPEIVVVTSHTAVATTATITRGAYGTTARIHPQGTVWAHVAVDQDFTEILTSITRPTDPYIGQEIYETDTTDYSGFVAGSWVTKVKMGQWASWVPVITQLNTPAQTVNWGRYTKVGRLIVAHFNIGFTAAGTASNAIRMNLPLGTATNVSAIGGSFRYFDTGNTNRVGFVSGLNTTVIEFFYDGFGNAMGNGDFAIANGDFCHGVINIESVV